MLAKILGALLLFIAVVLAVKLVFKTIGVIFSLIAILASVAVVALLVYAGWRLLDR